MTPIEKKVNKSFDELSKIFQALTIEDKAQLLKDCSTSILDNLGFQDGSRLLFKGMDGLILESQKKRWKPSYMYITINSYESKRIRSVEGRLKTFAKKKGFELNHTNTGYDHSDTYVEIALHQRNQWKEYCLNFEDYIDNNELVEFLDQFPEIIIEKKSRS